MLKNEHSLTKSRFVCLQIKDRLELVEAGLMHDKGWAEAVRGCVGRNPHRFVSFISSFVRFVRPQFDPSI